MYKEYIHLLFIRGRLFIARLADKSILNHTLIHLVNNLTQTFNTKYVVVRVNVVFRLKSYVNFLLFNKYIDLLDIRELSTV